MMRANKGKLVNVFDDEIDSSFQKHAFPKKVVILINDNCASTTEQFLFAAKQSSKVILAGDHTEGVLDYSNVRETPFSCMPYTLGYSTSRSRRIAAGQAIDNVGIKPDVQLAADGDWIKEAQEILEKP
jgi:C-terminal processing protease CtpA/Prc